MGFVEIGLRPTRRMIGMGVVEAHDVQTTFSSLALNADQFLGRDVIAVMGGIGARVACAYGRVHLVDAVEGVTKGWTRELEIVGIGYRAEMKGKGMIVFSLGYSHPIEYPLPTGVEASVDPKQTKIALTGIDRQQVGQVAAEMRSLRPPDPYKNKGVRYTGERLKKKVGKTGAK